MKPLGLIIMGLVALIGSAAASLAQEAVKPWQLWHQEAGSKYMADIEWFDAYTVYFIVPITIFVLILLIYVMIRFNAKANPTPSQTSHNTAIEVVWTVGPILVLIAIALPSFQLLNSQFDMTGENEPQMTVKATGHAWYWEYEYQDGQEIDFESRILGSEVIAGSKESAQEEREDAGKTDLKMYPRLLAVDNELVVPVGKTVRVLVTAPSEGVIHDFAMPAFGLKIDAVPGRMNETWFRAENEGIYYGQCSELCGVFHAYMPIAIRVVSEDAYNTWIAAAADDLEAANKALMAAVDSDKNIKLAGN